MPIYEYRCKKCNYSFELLRSINSSNDDLKCPECGASDPDRLISSASFKKSSSCSPGGIS
ncbi:MAG: zinc ribbon domain-containing protein [Spirochaetes bacterium]|nr:zinc ribbon domain-containing protein [Spirochaetota bacterium]